jgi:hypothetical protein
MQKTARLRAEAAIRNHTFRKIDSQHFTKTQLSKSTTPFIHNNITRNDTKVPPQTYFLLKDIHDKFTTEKNRGAVKRHLAGSRTQKPYCLIKSASEYVTLAHRKHIGFKPRPSDDND